MTVDLINFSSGGQSKLCEMGCVDRVDVDEASDGYSEMDNTMDVIDYFIDQGMRLNAPDIRYGISDDRVRLLNDFARAGRADRRSGGDKTFSKSVR